MKIKPAKKYRYDVIGMHCAGCAQTITRRLQKLPHLHHVSASYATEQVTFETTELDLLSISAELEKVGYSLAIPQEATEDHVQQQQTDSPSTVHANHDHSGNESQGWEMLLPVAGFTFAIMLYDLISQKTWWLPALPWPMQWLQFSWWLIATYALIQPGKQFITAIGRFFRYGSANMDTLIGFGVTVAYVYSTLGLFFPERFLQLGLPTDGYFDVSIVVIAFVLLGKHLESLAKRKTGEALRALSHLQAKSAVVIRNGHEETVPIADIAVGEILKVKAGEKIPLDGVVVEGISAVDESLLTGESLPVLKHQNDSVLGSSLNQEGMLLIRATKTGQSGFLQQMIELVTEAQASKAPIERLADQIAAWFVPVVLAIAILSAGGWLLLGGFSQASISLAIHALVGVLVIACPCALGLATPTAMMVAMGKAAQKGILVKDAATIERLSKVTTIVTDKTGTLTVGKPILQEIVVSDQNITAQKALGLAAGLEAGSTHPLAHAIETAAKIQKLLPTKVTNLNNQVGVGVSGKANGQEYWLGGAEMLKLKKVEKQTANPNHIGQIKLYLGMGKKILAQFTVKDELKQNARESIASLRELGLEVILLSGDQKSIAQAIAAQAGIQKIEAPVTPVKKLGFIQKLQTEGKIVAMVGDGVNDAPALAQADIGFAMSTGSDSAIATSGITLLQGDLAKLTESVILAKQTMRVVKQNLFWAFIYNIVGIPLAAGWLYPFLGTLLNPAFAGLAMALSSVSVVGNSLRLKAMR